MKIRFLALVLALTLINTVSAVDDADIAHTINLEDFSSVERFDYNLEDFETKSYIKVNSSKIADTLIEIDLSNLNENLIQRVLENIDIEVVTDRDFAVSSYLTRFARTSSQSIGYHFDYQLDQDTYFIKINCYDSSLFDENIQFALRFYYHEYISDRNPSGFSTALDLGTLTKNNILTASPNTVLDIGTDDQDLFDVYKFTLAEGGIVEITPNLTGTSYQYIEILNSDRELITRKEIFRREYDNSPYAPLSAGDYFITIYGVTGTVSSPDDHGFELKLADLKFKEKTSVSSLRLGGILRSKIKSPSFSFRTASAHTIFTSIPYFKPSNTKVRIPATIHLNKLDRRCKNSKFKKQNRATCSIQPTFSYFRGNNPVSIKTVIQKVKRKKNKLIMDVGFEKRRSNQVYEPRLSSGRFVFKI